MWPPAGAEPISIEELYDEVAARGIEYGPAFTVLRAAWWHGEALLAEIALDEGEREEALAYGAHPALLDGALQLLGASLLGEAGEGDQRTQSVAYLPFSFSGVEFHAPGASSLRALILPLSSDTVSLVVADEAGRPVVSMEALMMREVSMAQMGAARGASDDALFTVEWEASASSPSGELPTEPLVLLGAEDSALAASLGQGDGPGVELHADLAALCEAVERGRPVPEAVLVDFTPAGWGDSIALDLMHHTAHRLLALIQRWLEEEHFSGSRLAVVTGGAVAASPASDLLDGVALAPLWGLVRSAQAENPGRFVLIDVDVDADTTGASLSVALGTGESQAAIRGGQIAVPRLRPLTATAAEAPVFDLAATAAEAPALDPAGTILITGGTGALGARIARHLVSRHGAGRLLLASRAGLDAPGAPELQAELGELGADVRIAACDVSDRAALKTLLDSISEEHPLTAVVHAAGTIDSGLIDSMTPERLDRALAPKADGAWHLHELTLDAPLRAFVLFSSAAGLIGGPGQANYAAANAFLDALAAHRRARGLPASSTAWGLWDVDSAMTDHLGEADRRRLANSGMRTLSHEQGLALFDVMLNARQTLVIAVALDQRALRGQARTGVLPAMLSGLVRLPKRSAATHGDSLVARLASIPEAEREGVVLELVRSHVAAVAGYDSPAAVDEQRAFKELGFDSLTAVELRNRLNVVTGVALPATLVFDYPTPKALAGYLLSRVSAEGAGAVGGPAVSALADLRQLENVLSALAADDLERTQIIGRLRELAADPASADAGGEEELEAGTADEVFAALDRELGAL